MKKQKITMSDIAKIAGVSQGTVSNALNNRKGSLSNEKRTEILKIAADLGYTKTKDYGIIRLILVENETLNRNNFHNPFFSEMLRGIQSECESNNYQLLITYINISELNSIGSSDRQMNVSGNIILGTLLKPEDVKHLDNIEIPYVVMDTSIPGKPVDFVSIDNFNGMYEIGNYLTSMGHQIFGLITLVPIINNFKERRNGLIQALEDKELSFDPDYEIQFKPGDTISQLVKEYFQKLDDLSKPRPTAIVAMNDFLALELISGLKQLDSDISVTGFDNIEMGRISYPALTTVDVDKFLLGQSSVRRLMAKINNNDDSHQRILISTKLTIRKSVKNLNQ